MLPGKMLHLTGLPVAILIAVLAICFSSWIWKRLASPKAHRELPTPRGIPFLGHLPYARRNLFNIRCIEWAKKYGPVFRIQLGAVRLVVLNDINSVKKYYAHKALQHRPPTILLKVPNLEGVAVMSGQVWIDNRRFCMNLLRNLRYQKESMEMHVMAEVRYLVEMLSTEQGRPINFRSYILASLSNIMTLFLFGERYSFEDPRKKLLDDSCALLVQALEGGPWFDVLPDFLKHFAVLLPLGRRRKIVSFSKTATDIISNVIRKHKETLKAERRWDFIDHYLEKINDRKGDPNSSFTETYLIGNIVNILIGGVFSSSSNIHWHMLNCAHNADNLQTKIQMEIDRVIGPVRAPCWEDRENMPFTMAVISEMLRCKPTTGMPRGTVEDVCVEEYFIPKGTMILRNKWALDMNPELWEDPETFNPERFLTKDRSELIARPEHFIPFSYGKRMCPGETLAMMQLFLYLTTMLQKFRVMKEDGQTFSFSYQGEQKTQMVRQKLVFLPR